MSQKRNYTKEFKQEAVNLAIKSPSVTHAAKELGVPGPTLHSWINQFKDKSQHSPEKKSGSDVAALLEENRRLHKENGILQSV